MIVERRIAGGTLVTGDGMLRAGVAIDNGRIAAVAADDALPEAKETIDARGLWVLPGIIDSHVHLRDPGHPRRETFRSGTAAAAAGGITTILEMPISSPPVNSGEVLAARAEAVRGQALVNYAFYGGVGRENVDAVPGLVQTGAIAFKTFRHSPPPGRDAEFAGLCAPDDGTMWRLLTKVAPTGMLFAIHAEQDAILIAEHERLQRMGRRDPLAHAEARPEIAEVTSIAASIAMARAAGARLHIVHMSTGGGAALVRRAKEDGAAVTAETCPQYLLLTQDALREHGPFAKINPPLRTREAIDRLWEAIGDGTIDVIGTDHAPYAFEEKDAHRDNIWGAPSGAPGLETMLPLMLTQVHAGRLTPPRLVRLMSENAARLFGLYPARGVIRPGAYADLVLVDPHREETIRAARMHTLARDIARLYEGWRVRGVPVMTIVNGVVTMRHGEITGTPGQGQFLRPGG